MHTKHRTARVIGLAVAAAFLHGCAVNPLVRWDPPPASPGAPAMTLDPGKAYAARARAAYQQKIYQQVGLSTDLSSGMITLGAIVAALAAGKAHRDAILGATLIGGTAFTLGTWNLDKRRLLVYQGAVAGFNCAERAVSPLNMSATELDDLRDQLQALIDASADANAAIGATEAALNAWIAAVPNADKTLVAQYTAAIAAAEQVLVAAGQAQASGYALHYQARRAPDRLIEAVRKIDQEADAALMETLGDLNKVPTVIAGLAGAAGSIAPGSGVGQLFTDALKNAVPTGSAADEGENEGLSGQPGKAAPRKRVAVPPAALRTAAANMQSAVRALVVASTHVQAHLSAYSAALQSDTLADCGLGAINFAMSLDPAKLVVTNKAGTYTVSIRGGKPPYAVRQNGADVAGITAKGPDRMGASFDVKIEGTVEDKAIANFNVVDSSDPNKSVPFAVEVKSASGAGAGEQESLRGRHFRPSLAPVRPPKPAAVPASGAGSTAPTLSADAKMLDVLKTAPAFQAGGVQVSYPSLPTLQGGKFVVTVACSQPPKTPNACLSQAELRSGYLAALGGKANDVKAIEFRQFPPGPCVCAP